MPDAPAPPAPTAPAAPAVTPAPTEGASPAPAAAEPRATGATPKPAPTIRRWVGDGPKTYTTKPANHTPPPKVEAPAPTIEPAAAQSAPESPAVSASPSPDAVPPGADSAAATDTPGEPPKAEEAPKLTEAEEAKRIARINRASQKLSADQRAFAEEKRQYTEGLRRVALFDQAVKAGIQQGAKLHLVQQVFGWTPQQILDDIVAEGAKPEATRIQEESARQAHAQAEKIANLEKQVQDAVRLQQEQKIADDIKGYKRATILPAIDSAKHELTLKEFGSLEAVADAVFDLQEKRFRFTQREVAEGKRTAPELLTPSQAADQYEAHFRSLKEKWGGTSATPAPATTAKRTEPAPAKPSGSPAQKPALNGAYKPPQRSFTVRSVPR